MIAFTPQEKKVILFFLCVLICGTGIDGLVKRYAPAKRLFCLDPRFGKVDLNRADTIMLVGLPGIGEKLAQRIVDFRGAHGRFARLEDLRLIKGVHERLIRTIRDLVYIE